MGRSEERTDWAGNKYIAHYDDDGNKVGESRETTDWVGNPYTEHFNTSGDKIGESHERTDWVGNSYTEHVDASGDKLGESRETTDIIGNPYTEHRDFSGSKIGESRGKTNIIGDKYVHHEGQVGWSSPSRRSSSRRDDSSSDDYGSSWSDHSSGGGSYSGEKSGQSGLGIAIFLWGAVAIGVFCVVGYVSESSNTERSVAAGRSSSTPIPVRKAMPVPQRPVQAQPVWRRFDGTGTVYKIPDLKKLVGVSLENAWLYGSFVYRRHSGNVVTAVTGARLILVKEGFTEVEIECLGGFRLRPSTVAFFREKMGQPPAPTFDIRKDAPVELVSVFRDSKGKLRVYTRLPAALEL